MESARWALTRARLGAVSPGIAQEGPQQPEQSPSLAGRTSTRPRSTAGSARPLEREGAIVGRTGGRQRPAPDPSVLGLLLGLLLLGLGLHRVSAVYRRRPLDGGRAGVGPKSDGCAAGVARRRRPVPREGAALVCAVDCGATSG